MKTAYLDCFSGVSGDMFLGALLDVGLPSRALEEGLDRLHLKGYRLRIGREERAGIYGMRVRVEVESGTTHRTFGDIRNLIRRSDLTPDVKDKSIRIFENLAKAEGRIHGILPEEVHFHEVGAVDSIIDIVGVVYGVHFLEIGEMFVSSIPLGSGFVETAHGRLPLPAPATIALLRGIPTFQSGVKGEMVTPTGAALVRGLGTGFGHMPPMKVEGIGYGVGTRSFSDRPNLLRILIGENRKGRESDTVVILESNVDDCSSECLGYMMERLFEGGALDVVFCPVQMKKNRPGIQIQVIGRPDQKDTLAEIMFRESGTLGIRFRFCQREVRERSPCVLESPWGKILVKRIHGPDSVYFSPEYESCRNLARKKGLALREVYEWVAAQNQKEEG